MSWLEEMWFGARSRDAVARAALWPFSHIYGGIMAYRSMLYDSGTIGAWDPGVPAISVGNLTAGGTGKTPIAAWIAGLLAASARPAVVLRGYGSGDEVEVHRRLNPGIPVIANPDRVRAILEARQRGADVVVLDDAFQHRRVHRAADIVVLSAEQTLRPRRLLPAGPWREPLVQVQRANLIVVTRKCADLAQAVRALDVARASGPQSAKVPAAIVHLAPSGLVSVADGEAAPLERLSGASVFAIAAIGEPGLFAAQLESLGAKVTLAAFRDHHAFSDDDVATLARRASKSDLAVSTLKDVVKLGSRWPGPSRLWYVSQQPVVEHGVEHMNELLRRVLVARSTTAPSAG